MLIPSFLKMVAIATIADAVPLVGENRVIAKLGLELLTKGPHKVGLRALLEQRGLPVLAERVVGAGVDRARRDRVDPDRRQLDRQRPGDDVDRAVGGGDGTGDVQRICGQQDVAAG